MVSSEIRDTAMIAVSAILLASLLGFISYLIGVRGDFSTARNNEVYAKETLDHYREFNKFSGTNTLYGGDVITAVRDYYDSGIKIAVKRGSTIVYEMDNIKARQNPNQVTNAYLTGLFPMTKQYDAVLVYTLDSVSSITTSYKKPDNAGNDVMSIVFFEK